MERQLNDVFSETTVHLSTHWGGARDDNHSGLHLNFYVPRGFLRRLTDEYYDRFAGSVQSCITLLKEPLFGRENGERLELSTHLGGIVPLKYWVIRENDMPSKEVIEGLGQTFKQFVLRFASGSMRPTAERQGRYFSGASIEYRRVSKSTDAQLELRLGVTATATKERFEAFRSRAPRNIRFTQEAGKTYVRSDENSSSLGYGLFGLTGESYGNVTVPAVIEEMRELFDVAAADLNFSD